MHTFEYTPVDLNATEPYAFAELTKVPKTLKKIRFFDPFEREFEDRHVASDIDKIEFTYKKVLIQIPTIYYKASRKVNLGKNAC